MKFKRILSAILALSVVSTSMMFSIANAKTDTPAFDSNNIVMRMPVFSDAHIGASANFSSQHLQAALDTYKKYGKLDAMMMAGDFVDYGTEDQVKFFSEILSSKINLTETRLIPGIGNHELYNYSIQQNPFDVPQNLVKYLGDNKVYQGATKSEIEAGNYVTQVNCLTLITVNCWTYSGGVKFRPEDLKWFEDALKKTDPTKPVFVSMHPAVQGTHWGSNYGAYWATTDQDMYNILKNYPNATVFSGHLHFPVTNDSIIWQGDFTTVGTGSVSYASLEDKDASGSPYLGMSGSEPGDAQSISNGLLVEVDKSGNTKITRIDFMTGKEIKTPFYIDAPQTNKEHLNRYSQATITATNTAPKFEATAKVTAEKAGTDQSSIKVNFNAATDNDMVHSYEVSFYDTLQNKAVKTRSVYSDFYKVTQTSQMSNNI
ncbi:MAG: metallophosphoesterase [Oscillospiraceae bacterium]